MPADEDLIALSYTRGADRPLLDLTIGALLDRTAAYPIASPSPRVTSPSV